MYRKTNLFYVNGQDANFLTFSNYTEALTGNFLATDWKVYPSKFMCLYIPALVENSNKEDFIKNYLIGYYENKLAFLRDYVTDYYNEYHTGDWEKDPQDIDLINKYIDEDKSLDIEKNIYNLYWLLDTIKKYCADVGSECEINYIGEVSELDYNGSYADTICIIDGTEKAKHYTIETIESEQKLVEVTDTNTLYGWGNELNDTEYSDIYPTCLISRDGKQYYDRNDKCSLQQLPSDVNNIRFNVVIPLFDIVNMDYVNNFDQIDESVDILQQLDDDEIEESGRRSINNALGIWFSEKVIELDRDEELNYAPCWSLVISSQFKSFPYTDKYNPAMFSLRDDKHAFATYAQILARQRDNTNLLNDLSAQISQLRNDVDQLKKLDTLQNYLEIQNIENILKIFQNKIDSLETSTKEIVKQYIEENYNLKWIAR